MVNLVLTKERTRTRSKNSVCCGMGAGMDGIAGYSEFSVRTRQEWRRERGRERVTGKGGKGEA